MTLSTLIFLSEMVLEVNNALQFCCVYLGSFVGLLIYYFAKEFRFTQ